MTCFIYLNGCSRWQTRTTIHRCSRRAPTRLTSRRMLRGAQWSGPWWLSTWTLGPMPSWPILSSRTGPTTSFPSIPRPECLRSQRDSTTKRYGQWFNYHDFDNAFKNIHSLAHSTSKKPKNKMTITLNLKWAFKENWAVNALDDVQCRAFFIHWV